MTAATSRLSRDTSFDPFLFAAIGEERNGMLLSMLSALARLDLDPWREAASLSRLSAAAANERLTTLLTSAPNTQIEAPAPATILQLLKLLPKAAPDAAWAPVAAVAAKTKVSWPIVGFVILALLAICAQQLMMRRGAEAPVMGAPTSGAAESGIK